MNEVETALRRYYEAFESCTRAFSLNPSSWHRPDIEEFTELRGRLTPFAEAGEMRCQYALATIYWLGWCYGREEEQFQHYAEDIQVATQWWVAAASQGHWGALDNLIVCGVGEEADRVREAGRNLEKQRPDLVGWVDDMPVYWIDFMQELCKTIYGRVVTKLD